MGIIVVVVVIVRVYRCGNCLGQKRRNYDFCLLAFWLHSYLQFICLSVQANCGHAVITREYLGSTSDMPNALR